MRTIAMLLGLTLAAGLPAQAQDGYPKADVFAGFSYLRSGISNGVNTYGWQANVSGNVRRHLGIVGDFGGQYRSQSGARLSAYEFMIGPRFIYRTHRVTSFGQGLAGGVNARAFLGNIGASVTHFALGAGGGVDVSLSKAISLRVIQIDYIADHSGGLWGSNLRGGVGVVFKLGR